MLNFGTPSFPRGRALPLCVCVGGAGRGVELASGGTDCYSPHGISD